MSWRGHRGRRASARGSLITVEPGGAVELSGPPTDVLARDHRHDRRPCGAALGVRRAGLGLVLLGADPLRPAKRVNPGDRYRAMEQFFVASRPVRQGRR